MEGVMAMKYGATCEDVYRTSHPNSTLAYTFKEAAKNAWLAE
jgi:pyruvate/2-oxoglutarate dehydrogenase complex dihydrolipoamide dehydrogenase (E3) component